MVELILITIVITIKNCDSFVQLIFLIKFRKMTVSDLFFWSDQLRKGLPWSKIHEKKVMDKVSPHPSPKIFW